MIGCEYKSDDPKAFVQTNAKYVTDGKLDGEQKFTPSKGMVGVWLTRNDMKSLLPTLSLLKAMERMEIENTDLLFYKRTAVGMIKLVKLYKEEFEKMDTIGGMKGSDFAAAFLKKFTTINIV